MNPVLTILLTALAAVGGGGFSAIVVKRMSKQGDDADVRTTDINNLRSIIAELRADKAEQASRIDVVEARLAKVEERERHALTRAAVHEAWDQLALNFILTHDQNFPSPPPLTPPALPHEPPQP